MRRLPPGAAEMLGAALAFSLMSALVHLAGRRLPAQEIVLCRAVVTLVLSYGVLRVRGTRPWGNDRQLLFLRGLVGFGGLSCFYYAVVHLPVAEATVLWYLQPAFTALLAALLLREAPGRAALLAIGVSFVGVLLVTRPAALFGGAAAELDARAAVVALVGALFSAGAYTLIRRLRATEDPNVVVFWFPLVAVPLSIPLVAPVWVTPRGSEWLVLLGVGVATQVGQVLVTRGLHAMRAARATAISYAQVPLAAVWGVVLFGQVPGLGTYAGAALVGLGTWLVVRDRER